MNQTDKTNRGFVLNSRPTGAPAPGNFRLENSPVPTPGNGQVLLRTVYLSLDPYMRGRMSDEIFNSDNTAGPIDALKSMPLPELEKKLESSAENRAYDAV